VARAPTDYRYFDPMSVGVSPNPRNATKPSKIRDVVLTMSAHAPANDRCFDAIASINVMPNAVAPSARNGMTYVPT
jgi:hypothetical protein